MTDYRLADKTDPSPLTEPMGPQVTTFLSDPQSFALTVAMMLTAFGLAFEAGRSIALPFGGR